jgi:hypothetical protein
MKIPFFITGTPRSRTAWLSALFTTERTLCYHEPQESAIDLVKRHPDRTVGISDPSLVFKFDALRKEFPHAPWVYIQRNPDEALASLILWARPHFGALTHLAPGAVEEALRALMYRHTAESDRMKRHALVLTYDALDNPGTLEWLWTWVFPTIPWDVERWKVFNGLRIEQHAEKALQTRRCVCP